MVHQVILNNNIYNRMFNDDILNWDVSNVTDLSSNVTDLSFMFSSEDPVIRTNPVWPPYLTKYDVDGRPNHRRRNLRDTYGGTDPSYGGRNGGCVPMTTA